MAHAGLTERLRRDSDVSATSLDDRLRRASVQSVDSVRSDVDMSGMEQDKAARLIARRVSMATITRNRREKEEEMGMAPEWTCETKNRRCRYATDHFLESDAVVGALVLLVIIETAAVTGELMIERGFLSFENCQTTCDEDKCGVEGGVPGYQLRPTDFTTYRYLHVTSVSILTLFEIEFILMFYAVGFRCCCRKGAAFVLLDFIIVTMALTAEVFYLATSNTSVLFVLVLRIIRILNGLIQQQVRNQEKQHRQLEAKEEEMHERYDHQMRDMIMQTDEVSEQIVIWKGLAIEAVERLEDAGVPEHEIPELPRTTRRAAAPELIAKGSVNQAVMRQRMDFMRNVPMLKELAPHMLKRMAYEMIEQRFRPGDRIIVVGDSGDCMYILEEGEAAAYIDGVGQVVAYAPGDFFGELALITRQKRGATIIANSPVLALVLDRGAFESVKGTETLHKDYDHNLQDESVEVTALDLGAPAEEEDSGLMRRRQSVVGFTVADKPPSEVIVDGEPVSPDPPQKDAPPGEYDSRR